MRTTNPVFRTIEKQQDNSYASVASASYRGIMSKTALLLVIAILSGVVGINFLTAQTLVPVLIGAMIVGFISVIVASLSPRLAMPFGILYAVSEGILLGVITALINSVYPGVATSAFIATFAVFVAMLFLYSSRIIKVTSRFRMVMSGIMLGLLLYFIFFGIFSWFGIILIDTTSVGIAILISVVFIIYGAFMLMLDFDRAENIVSSGADKTYEWIVAVGLMVTLVWIYIEFLRLFAIIASRRR